MSTTAITGNMSTEYGFPWLKATGCDLPEQGGIGGNMRPDKPLLGAVCEERNKTFNWKTGEWKYTDQKCPEGSILNYEA